MQKFYALFVLSFLCGTIWGKPTPSFMGELSVLRLNYIRLLMAPENTPDSLTHLLVHIPRDGEIGDQMIVELQDAYPLDENEIRQILSTLNTNGSWPDIDYTDKKRSSWEPRKHAQRLFMLAKAHRSESMVYYRSPEVADAIHKGLKYWFDAGLTCSNWWYNQIGIPKTLGGVFILFEHLLTADEKQNAIREMEKAQLGMTGQNKIWLAGNVLIRGILQDDYSLVKEARDQITSEIVTGQEEGIKNDWSFHQHGPQQQFGNYGLAFIRSMGFYSDLFAGTSLAIQQEQLDLLSNLLSQGYRWILWKGYMDMNALNRQLFPNVSVNKAFSVAFAAKELAAGGNEKCIETASAILSDNFYPTPLVNRLTGHKHFFDSDMTIHRTNTWMASLKMASTRVIGTEQVNEDNMKGHYLADGALYTYVDGDEYLNIFPYWDWRKIPGITAYDTDGPIPIYKYTDPRSRNQSSFVGGVSHKNVGMSVMELNRDGLQARKAWVFTDDFIFAMGGGIRTDTTLAITTSIDQRLKKDQLWVYKATKEWASVDSIMAYAGSDLRFLHDKTGYIVMQGDTCVASEQMRTGQWHDFMGTYPPADITGETVSLYIKHGTSPKNGSYGYFILPNSTRQEVESFDTSVIHIVRNDPSVQAVLLPKKDIVFIAAQEPVQIKLDDGFEINIREVGIYLYYKNNGDWNRKFQVL